MTLYRWMHELGRWLAEPWKVWIAVAVTVAVPVVAFSCPISASDQFRYSGLAFELLGIGTVWAGLRDRRLLFRKQGTLDKTTGWLKRFPRLGAKPQNFVVQLSGASLTMTGGAVAARLGSSSSSSVESRLAELESKVQTLRTEQADLGKRIQQEVCERQEADKAEHKKRESDYKEIYSTLDSLGAGNLPLETLGLLWLSLGVMLSTWSSGIP